MRRDGTGRLRAWGLEVERRIQRDRDVVLPITGEEGSGKSTLAWDLAEIVDPTFDRSRIGWSFEQVANLALDAPRGSCILWDEGVEGLVNRGAMSKENTIWQEWLMLCRSRNLMILTCFPRFDSLDLYVREHRAWGWIWVEDQGRAIINVKDYNPYSGVQTWIPWVRVRFPERKDAAWTAYKADKDEFVRAHMVQRLAELSKVKKRRTKA